MTLKNVFGDIALDATLQSVLTEVAMQQEFIPVSATVFATGDTALYTPQAGKRLRLRWVYALNDPTSANPARITIKLGNQTKYVTYGISKKQVDTGPVDGALIINLSQAGSVACTFRIEEL